MKAGTVLRVARPTDHLTTIAEMYAKGLDFTVLAEFHDHEGFDGIILGHPQQPYHLEFTTQRGHHVGKAPTQDRLLVFVTVQVVQVMLQRDGLLQPRYDEGGARVQAAPCMRPRMLRSDTQGHGDAAV